MTAPLFALPYPCLCRSPYPCSPYPCYSLLSCFMLSCSLALLVLAPLLCFNVIFIFWSRCRSKHKSKHRGNIRVNTLFCKHLSAPLLPCSKNNWSSNVFERASLVLSCCSPVRKGVKREVSLPLFWGYI